MNRDDPETESQSRSGGSNRHPAAGGGKATDAPEEAPDVETGTVRTNDIETHYVRRGEGPAIVFVHGMYMNATQWEPQMEALSDEFTTIAYDVRGHGYTGGSDRTSYDVELYASDLDALLDGLGVENPILCGLSMGGCIAQVYAANHPGTVAGLVLSDTFTAAPLPLAGRLIFANLRVFSLLDRVVRYPTLNRIQMWVGNRLSPGVAGDHAAIQRVMEAGPTIPHGEFAKVARSVAEFPDSDFETANIEVPTLVTYGENAPAVFRDAHERLARAVGTETVKLGVVPDAGHASNLDNPEYFSRTVRTFAREVLGSD